MLQIVHQVVEPVTSGHDIAHGSLRIRDDEMIHRTSFRRLVVSDPLVDAAESPDRKAILVAGYLEIPPCPDAIAIGESDQAAQMVRPSVTAIEAQGEIEISPRLAQAARAVVLLGLARRRCAVIRSDARPSSRTSVATYRT